MGPVAYTVIAELPDQETLREYLDWLAAGHLAAVVAGGASRAEVIGPLPGPGLGAGDGPESPFRVESRYIFPTLEAFRTYETVHAPRLRAEGAGRFGPDRGISMSRRVGLVVDRAGA